MLHKKRKGSRLRLDAPNLDRNLLFRRSEQRQNRLGCGECIGHGPAQRSDQLQAIAKLPAAVDENGGDPRARGEELRDPGEEAAGGEGSPRCRSCMLPPSKAPGTTGSGRPGTTGFGRGVGGAAADGCS